MIQLLNLKKIMKNNLPIAIFDSGLGGLTVLKELNQNLPKEQFIYFGDTAHVPYGNKSPQTIINYSKSIINFLIKHQIKLIVVGCNTASAVALEDIKKLTNLPVIDVIQPCVDKAIKTTKNNKIGVIGTSTTIQSNCYNLKIKAMNPKIEVFSIACPLLVPIIEEGIYNHDIMTIVAEMYLNNVNKMDLDALILGCTHYPIIKHIIEKILGNKIKIIDSSITTAEKVKLFLQTNQLFANKNYSNNIFYVTDELQQFKTQAKIFLDKPIEKIKQAML